MFILRTIEDRIRIHPALLFLPTEEAIHKEIDKLYPNRVYMHIGLIIGRYGSLQKLEAGLLCDEGAPHFDCSFRVVVFHPFVDEVLIGYITKSSADGICVSIGFFSDIFIPAYWMLNPSRYDEDQGLWVWTPQYDEEGGDEEEGGGEDEEEEQYEMYIGAKIRFKVKSIQFTQITNTAKGMQATTTTTALQNSSNSSSQGASGGGDSQPRRKRSSSTTVLDEGQMRPAPMRIVGSICEDGLGLISWWDQQEEEEEEGEEEAEEGDMEAEAEEGE